MLDKPSVHATIAEVCARHREDSSKAVFELVRKAAVNNALRDALILLGAKQAVRSSYSEGRAVAIASISQREAAERPRMPAGEVVKRLAAKAERIAFAERYALWGHMLLRDARVDDLRESAQQRRTQAAGNIRRARFEEALAKKMGGSRKTVGSFFSAEDIERIASTHHVEE